MACVKREQTGSCGHSICPHPDKTEYGYECVEIIAGFCEVGENCFGGCEHSWKNGTKKANDAELAFRRYWEEMTDWPSDWDKPRMP